MALDRKALRLALFERLQQRMEVSGIHGVKWSRRDLSPADIREFPAVLVLPVSDKPTIEPGLPVIWDLEMEVRVFVSTTRESEVPDDQLDDIEQAIEAALEHQATEGFPEGGDERFTTLGDLALWCQPAGAAERISGETSGRGFLSFPVMIRAYDRANVRA